MKLSFDQMLIPICALLSVSTMAQGTSAPRAVATFECIGLYWEPVGGGTNRDCEVRYRTADNSAEWRNGFPLWYDARNREYRGSIVMLRPGTKYEVELQLAGMKTQSSLVAQTWSDEFPVGKSVVLPTRSRQTLTVSDSGSSAAYVLYGPGAGEDSAEIDVAGEQNECVVVKASYVILRGLTLRNARIHGILLADGAHDVVIEHCDISGWGRVDEDGWGKNYDSAIYSKSSRLVRVIVQRNRIHHPRSNSNNWREARPRPGKREPNHPEGPQAVCFWDSDGNHVIRYNTVFSDDTHQYNDVFGAGQNFSTRGFPNCDSDIYGNVLSHCWDDAIESEGANCNVRVWGNYMTDAFVGVACASTSVGPLYVWRNVTGVIRESPERRSGAFLKTSDRMGGGRIFVFHNTILQPDRDSEGKPASGAAVGLGWGGPMVNVVSRNNVLNATRDAIADRRQDASNDFDYDLLGAPIRTGTGQEAHGIRVKPEFVPSAGYKNGTGTFALRAGSPGVDAGVVLPNFNDGFAGNAPDFGAQEEGSGSIEFGSDAQRSK